MNSTVKQRGDTAPGLAMDRVLTTMGEPAEAALDRLEWKKHDTRITNAAGRAVFSQRGVEAPASWTPQAVNLVANKYFRGVVGEEDRERSVRELVRRVADTIACWGQADGYFASDEDTETFRAELSIMLATQRCAFNSPVWFNVGIDARPQCSACFINSVADTMESILELAKTEGMLFKYGSGTGSNLSALRGSSERLTSGGTASGPVSFMRGYDAFAGVIKSGGRTRRAAKLICLDADHPDLAEFIDCKAAEERKAWALIDAGYDGSFNGEAYASISFQNANNSVRAGDDFMEACEAGRRWKTRLRTGGDGPVYDARELLRKMAEACHLCGDPGIQFDTTINRWHTCKADSRIRASNPCSEYMFIEDSACNLASINLLRCGAGSAAETGKLDLSTYRHIVRVMITAMEIIVGNAAYPTPRIEQNSHRLRPLGLGYTNLGSLLMTRGTAYDSDAGRRLAAGLTAELTAEAYAQSAAIAEACGGPFESWEENRDHMLEVMRMHAGAADTLAAECDASSFDADPLASLPADETAAARLVAARAAATWKRAVTAGEQHGYRNAQASVIAPTGTISFMMDCDTTGVEPAAGLVTVKQLVGGGTLRMQNDAVSPALRALGYDQDEVSAIAERIAESGTAEGSGVRDEHLPVFDTAMRTRRAVREISAEGHLKMVAAVQPFISGAVSKTVNMPETATAGEIEEIFIHAWKLGLKAVSVYRDASKRTQPLAAASATGAPGEPPPPARRKLPDTRRAVTHKFNISGHKGYVTVGMYEDGSPGEIFLVMAKEGSTISGFGDNFAQAVSYALQYGVPLQVLVDKFSHVRFEPAGATTNPQVRFAKSIVDYIFRWLATQFLDREHQIDAGINHPTAGAGAAEASGGSAPAADPAPRAAGDGDPTAGAIEHESDSPSCAECGAIMVRTGSCYACRVCGATSGCG